MYGRSSRSGICSAILLSSDLCGRLLMLCTKFSWMGGRGANRLRARHTCLADHTHLLRSYLCSPSLIHLLQSLDQTGPAGVSSD